MDYKEKALDHVRSVCVEFVEELQYEGFYQSNIHLEHWLRGISNKMFSLEYLQGDNRFIVKLFGAKGSIYFGMDGQPATREDYKAYCDIVEVLD